MLHLDMDAFFASVEQLTRPTLRGRPVLVGGLGGRGVVAGASYESRVFGARSAMPMHQARRLIGVTAVVLPPRGVVYGVASRRVFDTVRAMVPVVEQLSFDEAFGEPPELAGASATDVEQFCAQLAATGARRDRPGRLGRRRLGQADRQDRVRFGQTRRHPGDPACRREARCSTALPVRKLWGIGPVAEEKLHRLGIETIGQLAALSEAEVANILGATIGPALHRLARGIDDRPVAERAEAKQISAESTFAADLTTLDELREAIAPIAEHAHQRLCRDGRGARTVTVKLKKSDMSTLTRSATLPYATTDGAALAALARRLLLDPRQIGPIRLLGVGFSGLSRRAAGVVVPDLELAMSDADAGRRHRAGAAGRRRVRERRRRGVAGRRRRHAPRSGARLGAGRRPRRGHRAVRNPRLGPGPGANVPADDHRHRAGEPGRQPRLARLRRRAGRDRVSSRRSTTSRNGSRAANAAITSTRA